MFFYFEIDEIRYKKRLNLRNIEINEELNTKQNIHYKVDNEGE